MSTKKKATKKATKKVVHVLSKWALDNWVSREAMCEEGQKAFDFLVKAEKKGLSPNEIVKLAFKKDQELLQYLPGVEQLLYDHEDVVDQARLKLGGIDNSLFSKEFQAAVEAEEKRLDDKEFPTLVFSVDRYNNLSVKIAD